MWTNEKIYKIALAQSAKDISAAPEDFLKEKNVIVLSQESPEARKYLKQPFTLQMVSYGSNIVASVSPEFREIAEKYFKIVDTPHSFETPAIHALEELIEPLGQKICFMAEYFLPDLQKLTALDCPYELRELTNEDFFDLYTEKWSNALCKDRSHLDVLGIGAYDNGELIGLAACSADCDTMWQIGIDVDKNYRRRGVASALTSRLALRILEKGKVPFYCAAWCNIPSVRNAIKSGFVPAWVEMTAKPRDFVMSMINKENK